MKFSHHNMAAWKTDTSGRFIIHRSLNLGTRGAAGDAYVVEDTETGKVIGARNMAYVKCLIAYAKDGQQLEPYFQKHSAFEEQRATGSYKDYKIALKAHGEWQSIKEV